MEETTRLVIAYLELAIGIPVVAAKIIWLIPSALLGKVLGGIVERMDQIVDGGVEGFLAICFSRIIFDRFTLPASWTVPVLLIFVIMLWNWSRNDGVGTWAAAVGVLSGFVAYPRVMGALPPGLAAVLGASA